MSTALNIDEVVCIHLHHRKDRVLKMKRQARKKQIRLRLFRAIEDKAFPNLGKFASHLQCIKDAQRKRLAAVIILEDDAKIILPKFVLPKPPVKWDMLYLGGNIQSVLPDADTDASQVWKRVCCLLTHAYAIHSDAYETVLTEGYAALKAARASNDDAVKSALHIDEWYCKNIHTMLQVYITTPERVVQADGYSDVKRRHITYHEQLTGATQGTDYCPPPALAKPAYSEFIDGASGGRYAQLAIPDHVKATSDANLPLVALVTCIRNQLDLFQFQQWCYYRLDYPRDKLCWMIADDSADEFKVGPLIDGKDASIKYIRCDMDASKSFLSIAKKINLCMKYLGPNYKLVLHVSPDCYYPPSHVRDRVKLMMSYPGYGCFGSTRYGVFDVTSSTSYEQTQPDGLGNPTMLFGPSLSYTRSWWQSRPFDEAHYTLETFYFIRGRWDGVLDIPYSLVCIALTHGDTPISETARYGITGKAVTSSKKGYAVEREAAESSKSSGGARWGSHLNDGELADSNVLAKRVDRDAGFEQGWDMTTKNMMLMLAGVL